MGTRLGIFIAITIDPRIVICVNANLGKYRDVFIASVNRYDEKSLKSQQYQFYTAQGQKSIHPVL
jgi:hypothetical protein